MRITIVQGAFLPIPPQLGGAVEKIWFRLGQEFAIRGHEITHISRRFEGLPANETIGGVRHVRIRGYNQPASLLKLKFLDFLYSIQACRTVPVDSDIVVTNTFWAPMLLSKNLCSRAYVDIQRMPKGQCRFYSQSGRLRANSTPVAEAIRRELPPEQHWRISMIPNPLPFEPPALHDFSLKEKKILYCGRVHPEKGLELVIQAMATLTPGWSLEIVGPWETNQGGGGTEYLNRLRMMAQGLPVTFHGPEFDMTRLSRHYQRASIFAYPSIAEKGETFGLSPLEAMSWGCVPVVSNLACFKDFIHHQSNGLSFDHRSPEAITLLAAAMRILTEDTVMLTRFSKAAALTAETHSPARIADVFLADFKQVCQEQLPIA